MHSITMWQTCLAPVVKYFHVSHSLYVMTWSFLATIQQCINRSHVMFFYSRLWIILGQNLIFCSSSMSYFTNTVSDQMFCPYVSRMLRQDYGLAVSYIVFGKSCFMFDTTNFIPTSDAKVEIYNFDTLFSCPSTRRYNYFVCRTMPNLWQGWLDKCQWLPLK